MNTLDKLTDIMSIIKDIDQEDPFTASVLLEGFGLSLNLLRVISEAGGRDKIDVSEHLEIITKILGISLEELVKSVLEQTQPNASSDKEPDQTTLDFITGDLDDYEKFIAQNSAKKDLDFLSKSI
jgi:oligoribonuclease (3'-5' exoribonuclease)